MPRHWLPPPDAPTAKIPAKGAVRARPPDAASPDWLRLQHLLWARCAVTVVRSVQLPPAGPDIFAQIVGNATAQRPADVQVRLDPRSLDLVVEGADAEALVGHEEVCAFLHDVRSAVSESLAQLCHASGGSLLERVPRATMNRLDWPSARQRRKTPSQRRLHFRAGSEALSAFLQREDEARMEACAVTGTLPERIALLLAGCSLPSDLCLWKEPDAAPPGAPLELRLGARLVGDFGLLADPERLVCVATGLAVVPPLPMQPHPLPEDFALRLCLLIARAADLCSPDLPHGLSVRLFLVGPMGVAQALLEVAPKAWGHDVTLAALRLAERAQVALPEGLAFSCDWLRQLGDSANRRAGRGRS